MNSGPLFAEGIWGSGEDINALANKQKAKVLLVSDSHGRYSTFSKIMDSFGPDCDAVICCGDSFADLSHYIEHCLIFPPSDNKLPPVAFFVLGNCDCPSYNIHDGGEFIHLSAPERLFARIAGKDVFITHGHRFRVDYGIDHVAMVGGIADVSLVCYGHTHIPLFEKVSVVSKTDSKEHEVTVVNPGSCARPRGGSKASVAVISIGDGIKADFYSIEENAFGHLTFSPYSVL